VRGTADDYRNLREHAIKHAPTRPSYVTDQALNLLQNANRRNMLEATRQHENHWFTDGLAWMLDKVPRAAGFNWVRGLGQAALKPFRGDHLDEVDEQYARLVNDAYLPAEEQQLRFEHWSRQPEFDSNYVSVYDNDDGHRFVAVRGTKLNRQDIGQDAQIGVRGSPSNLIGQEVKRVLDNTEPGRTVDVGGHSLGTSLILTAYENDVGLQDRVHETFLYNPAMSPLVENVTQRYEDDDRVRYFIDLFDPVSVGGLGEKGPVNVVYRSSYSNPLGSHNLVDWGGSGLTTHDELPENEGEDTLKRAELPYDSTGDGIPNATASDVEKADDFLMDFGTEFPDSGAWDVYWNPGHD
jgi:hypothetical protein